MLGEFVTTEAGTGIVHMAPGHGEDDFFLCRANGIAVPDTVQGDGTYYPSMPLFAGVHVYKAADPVCDALARRGHAAAPRGVRPFLPAFLALQGAADLPRHAELVHPHGRRGADPRERAGRHRCHPFRARKSAATASAPWSNPGRTGASPASAPGACRSRSSSTKPRMSPCATRQWWRGSWTFSPPRARMPGMSARRRISSAPSIRPRITNRSSTSSMSGSNPARPMPSCWKRAVCRRRPISISKARTSIAAGSRPRCWKPSARAA